MRLGVLDVGSNTVHLLVLEAHRGAHPWPAYSEKTVLRLAERIRQGMDLEHWAAFRRSFDAMSTVLDEVDSGRRGEPPATVVFLSGDVHYSYLMRAGSRRSAIYQAVCSPIRSSGARWTRRASITTSRS